MKTSLTAIEARVIGALLEKQVTTPDQYPLSLNALVNACNQKSNRDPMMQLDEGTVKSAVDGLGRRHLVMERSSYGSRVQKYQQIFCNTEFGSLKFTPQETGIVCELLLRGPQTPGELRSRVPRFAALPDPGVIETLLEGLASRPEPVVVQLTRESGRRDSRWAQLFEDLPVTLAVAGTEPGARSAEPAEASTPSRADLLARIAALEDEVADLRAELATPRQ